MQGQLKSSRRPPRTMQTKRAAYAWHMTSARFARSLPGDAHALDSGVPLHHMLEQALTKTSAFVTFLYLLSH